MSAGIVATGVGVVIDGNRILDAITLEVERGEVVALVGPNGAGKSTLLSVLSGDRPFSTGDVEINGRPLSQYRHRELARERAVLTQENQLSFGFTVGQVVKMGRNPWVGTPSADDDDRAVAQAMSATDVDQLVTRRFTTLSGGERARVSLARVLAQAAPVVMLDEPTATLDLKHQEDVMRVVRRLASEGHAVLVVVHDLSLAAAYAHRVAVIAKGALAAAGTPREVLTADLLSDVYGLPVTVSLESGQPVVVPLRYSQEP